MPTSSEQAKQHPGLTPMMQQYFKIKDQHQDHIVFFRLGDFYEMFFEDAITVTKELGLTLTGRDCGLAERAPMCGIPYHASDQYVAKLIRKGFKVAICEQVEDPAFAKGVVSREVVRVVTPGTLLEETLLQEDTNNFLCSIFYDGVAYGLAFADISTGEVNLLELRRNDDAALTNELSRYFPREVIFSPQFVDKPKIAKFMREKLSCTADMLTEEEYELESAGGRVSAHFENKSLGELGLKGMERCTRALGGLLSYLQQTQKVGVERLCTLNIHQESRFMALDASARTNLELLHTLRSKEKRGSLLWVLDHTKTPMGKRLIKSYLVHPLVDPARIEKRLNAVEELTRGEMLCADLVEVLGGIQDIERLLTRVVYGNATPREVTALGDTLGKVPTVKALLRDVKSQYLMDINNELDPLDDLASLIAEAIVENPPNNMKNGGVIQAGFHPELSELRNLMENAQGHLADLEAREREATGIKNLRVSYNKVFGYFLEVTKSNIPMVPDHYIRKQTLTNTERYLTQELKDLEQRIMMASEQAIALEQKLYNDLRIAISRQTHRIQKTAGALARLDVFCSFATVSLRNRYVRPLIDTSSVISIQEGRHPVVEQVLDGAPFVPNDTLLDTEANQIAVITGPNMAGKSTYMRQTALIVLLAQIGCFVPAAAARVGVVDGIYTRVGASDDLSSGQSTFMVEMVELSSILRSATAGSLLVLDEIGRGTSTYDGMSIARAVLEYIAQPKKLGAKTLFATHYHELTEMEDRLDRVKNYNVAVKKRGDDITFLRKIVRGGADDSFGIEVSKLAGIPDAIVHRAHEILKDLESAQPVRPAGRRIVGVQVQAAEDIQISLQDTRQSELESMLRDVDLNTLTPIEALTLLYKLREKVAE